MTTTNIRIIAGILFACGVVFLIWRRNNKSDY
jgi:LPXTG-motif cell wall-anchored protein